MTHSIDGRDPFEEELRATFASQPPMALAAEDGAFDHVVAGGRARQRRTRAGVAGAAMALALVVALATTSFANSGGDDSITTEGADTTTSTSTDDTSTTTSAPEATTTTTILVPPVVTPGTAPVDCVPAAELAPESDVSFQIHASPQVLREPEVVTGYVFMHNNTRRPVAFDPRDQLLSVDNYPAANVLLPFGDPAPGCAVQYLPPGGYARADIGALSLPAGPGDFDEVLYNLDVVRASGSSPRAHGYPLVVSVRPFCSYVSEFNGPNPQAAITFDRGEARVGESVPFTITITNTHPTAPMSFAFDRAAIASGAVPRAPFAYQSLDLVPPAGKQCGHLMLDPGQTVVASGSLELRSDMFAPGTAEIVLVMANPESGVSVGIGRAGAITILP